MKKIVNAVINRRRELLAAEPADFQVVGMSHSIFKNEAMHDVGGPKRLPTHQDRPAPH